MWGRKGYRELINKSDEADRREEARRAEEAQRRKDQQQKEEEEWKRFCEERQREAERKDLMKF